MGLGSLTQTAATCRQCSGLLIRPCEASSGIANPLVLKVGHHALRRLLEHGHVLVRSST